MSEQIKYKQIIDSVHGNIWIEDKFCRDFVDTPGFQRLRRIEQSAIRSVYPCARHDRFTHSLGVFHLGTLIAQNLRQEAESADDENAKYYGLNQSEYLEIEASYRIACLLHDIAHAPFSHTFEEQYGEVEKLAKLLMFYIPDLSADLNDKTWGNVKQHEFASAIVCACDYHEQIVANQGDLELVARMIIGLKYADIRENKRNQIANCFISLLNGKIFDADKLDYVCRDVWASGYDTSSININRLIAATHIKYNNKDAQYVVCFDHKVINEIASIIIVKNFQGKYVINHHTVIYDQYLLQKAVREAMTPTLSPNETYSDDPLSELADPISLFIHIDNVINNTSIKHPTGYVPALKKCKLLCDDDIVSLIKRHNGDAFKEWSSRQFSMKPLWKSPEEFLWLFKGLTLPTNKDEWKTKLGSILHDNKNGGFVKCFILNKAINLSEVKILVKDKCIAYDQLFPKETDANQLYAYVYIKEDLLRRKGGGDVEKGILDYIEEIKTCLD